MEQRISLITIGTADLARACAFYAALGWSVANDWRDQDVAFFDCGGMVFAIWNRHELAADSGTSPAPPGAVTIAHNVRDEPAVDAVLEEARAAGATIVRSGAATPWGGYSGAFLDLDGHAWEIAYNPAWPLTESGAVTLP